ncbi:EAL domain-containing protein [Candidatus Accumulibacter sp. ACC003]|uniref:EAL domain-containing protein n=1 Tax=Candidatus Accumulibacter sp. ACC003 TaxID=2823334 RepID=UPI0025B98998|nr:EAL domain-containing protein [Candidatus Accumulibacter sp. ACC003]
MTRSPRLTIARQLTLGFGAVGLLVLTLLGVGELVVRDAAKRLETTLTQQVRPLAKLNRLQTRINRIRVIEIEISKLTDYFAVSSHVAQLQAEMAEFSAELDARSAHLVAEDELVARQLHESWTRYRADLIQVIDRAEAMQMIDAERISIFESATRFRWLSDTLRQLAEDTETHAGIGFERALSEHQSQRRIFLAISSVGLLIIALLGVLQARSLSSRISRLGLAAREMAENRTDQPLFSTGSDELTDLADAFNAMQEKVHARESSLREANSRMEDRIDERTRELHESNLLLRREIDERHVAESRLRLVSEAIQHSPAGVMIIAVDGDIEYANATLHEMAGLDGNAFPQNLAEIVCGQSCGPRELEEALAAVRQSGEWQATVEGRRNDRAYCQHVRISPVVGDHESITHFLVVYEDITLRRQHEQQIIHQAQYDGLTHLPNRLLAMDRLGQAIAVATRDGGQVIVMFIDLDDFKKVNDSLGHDVGDSLLVEAASRLGASIRAEDTVARQGGDEFLVILGNLHATSDAQMLAMKIISAFAPPFLIDQHELFVSPSIGIAVYPNDGDSPSTLLRNADLAMYDAKDSGRNTYRFFNQDVHDHSVRRLAIEHRLRSALSNKELRLVYQPLVDVLTHRVIGAEALLRWASPDFGLLTPDSFIHIAEQTGMIVDIGDWVVETACGELRTWLTMHDKPLQMAVNVSPRQFRDSRITETIRACLQRHRLPQGSLQIEVTEGLLIRNRSEVLKILQEIETLGVRIAMDDFGTGYSSLSYLKRFPFHTLKIDREFIRDLADNSDDRALVAAAIRMGKSLGLRVVAEGVESEEQLRILAELGCDSIQGYLISKPVPAEDFRALLDRSDWLSEASDARREPVA